MVFNPRWPPNLRGSARWRIFCPTCRKKRKAHVSKAASLRRIKFTFVHFCRNEIPCFRVGYLRGAHKRGSAVVDRQYLERFPPFLNRRDSQRAANKILWPSRG